MYCSNCGSKLVDNAKFCSGCGTAVRLPEAVEPVSVQVDAPAVEPIIAPLAQDAADFHLLGYSIQLPEATSDYVDIRNRFEQLAEQSRERMAGYFGGRYRSLDDLIRLGEDDAYDLLGSAVGYSVELLHSVGIYNVDISKFTKISMDYTGYWDGEFGELRDKFRELVDYKEAKKEYRSMRKDGRGKMVGGGFGLGGAVKGMAMAGSVNMATGLLHSFSNALGNAATSAEVSGIKNKLFQDPEMRRTLSIALYLDIYNLHLAVIACLNDPELTEIARTYDDDINEAYTIYKNLISGRVREEDKREILADILLKDPFKLEHYELALAYCRNEDEEAGLTSYAEYFGVPIHTLLQRRQEAQEHETRLSAVFGETASMLDSRLQDNPLYHDIKHELTQDPAEALLRAFFSIQNESVRTKVYFMPAGSDAKGEQKLASAIAAYAPIQQETPLLLFDNTAFGSAKDGFLLTDRRIYVHNMMSKAWSMELEQIGKLRLSSSEILFGQDSADIAMISAKDRQDFFDFVELLLVVLSCSQSPVFAGQWNSPLASRGQELLSASRETAAGHEAGGAALSGAVAEPSPAFVDKNAAIHAVRQEVAGLGNAEIRRYLFLDQEHDKAAKKFINARTAYAPLGPGEIPVVLFDNTAFGSAKDGFLITDRRIYIHNMMEQPVSIPLAEVRAVGLKGSELLLNQHKAGIQMISSSHRPEFVSIIEKMINTLK